MVNNALETAIGKSIGSRLQAMSAVSGGDINEAYYVRSQSGEYFVKVQSDPQGADMFACERSGLQELMGCGAIKVPEVYDAGTDDNGSAFLIMSWHKAVPSTDVSWTLLGEQLSELHRCSDHTFGFPEDNFIGSLPQMNEQKPDWPDFYATNRIEAMLGKCGNFLNNQDIDNWLSIRKKLPSIISCDTPSLLHGDLWGGNAMHTARGPLIFDPAVYYGDGLVDIAMTKLFGGFPKGFYDAYFSGTATSNEDLERLELYQLYYLLVHLALFGSTYLGPVRGILDRYA